MLNTRADQVVKALTEYEKVAAPAYRRLPAPHAAEARWAKNHLHCALIIVLNQAFAAIQEAESAVLYEVLSEEFRCTTPEALLHAFLHSVSRHFGATRAAVYGPDADHKKSWECIAALHGNAGLSVTPAPALDRQIRKIETASTSQPLARDWPASRIWTIRMGTSVIQLGFDAERPLLPREAELLSVLAQRCGLALGRLDREAQTQRMSVRMLEVEELDRRRISRELHDDSAQALAVIRLQLEMAELTAPPEAAELRERLTEIRELTERTIRSVRGLISDLSPTVLEQLGLAAAVRQLANRFQGDRDVKLGLQISKLARMHPRLEVVIYRVLQECFRNIAQHSQAAHVNVSLTCSDGVLRLEVVDDGVGFNVEEAIQRRNCYGLIGIRERVTLLGGTFCVESTSRTRNSRFSLNGTRVMVQLTLTGEYPG